VARRIIIAGGGHIGAFLGTIIEKEHGGVSAKIIEANAERAHQIADTLERTVVINGDVIDPEILDEASVSECEAIIAVTNDDETNILASLLAKRFGTKRAITLINNVTYRPLITSLWPAFAEDLYNTKRLSEWFPPAILAAGILRGRMYSQARDAVWDFAVSLRLPQYFWLGLRGFAGALAWLPRPIDPTDRPLVA